MPVRSSSSTFGSLLQPAALNLHSIYTRQYVSLCLLSLSGCSLTGRANALSGIITVELHSLLVLLVLLHPLHYPRLHRPAPSGDGDWRNIQLVISGRWAFWEPIYNIKWEASLNVNFARETRYSQHLLFIFWYFLYTCFPLLWYPVCNLKCRLVTRECPRLFTVPGARSQCNKGYVVNLNHIRQHVLYLLLLSQLVLLLLFLICPIRTYMVSKEDAKKKRQLILWAHFLVRNKGRPEKRIELPQICRVKRSIFNWM